MLACRYFTMERTTENADMAEMVKTNMWECFDSLKALCKYEGRVNDQLKLPYCLMITASWYLKGKRDEAMQSIEQVWKILKQTTDKQNHLDKFTQAYYLSMSLNLLSNEQLLDRLEVIIEMKEKKLNVLDDDHKSPYDVGEIVDLIKSKLALYIKSDNKSLE